MTVANIISAVLAPKAEAKKVRNNMIKRTVNVISVSHSPRATAERAVKVISASRSP